MMCVHFCELCMKYMYEIYMSQGDYVRRYVYVDVGRDAMMVDADQ
jgi:hypothetical protein